MTVGEMQPIFIKQIIQFKTKLISIFFKLKAQSHQNWNFIANQTAILYKNIHIVFDFRQILQWILELLISHCGQTNSGKLLEENGQNFPHEMDLK